MDGFRNESELEKLEGVNKAAIKGICRDLFAPTGLGIEIYVLEPDEGLFSWDYDESIVIVPDKEGEVRKLGLYNCLPTSHVVGDEFRYLTNLESLHISMDRIYGGFFGIAVPLSFWMSLEKLRIDGYNIVRLDTSAPCSLKQIELRNCTLREVPFLNSAYYLDNASFVKCGLTKVENLDHLDKLKQLDLSKNRLMLTTNYFHNRREIGKLREKGVEVKL